MEPAYETIMELLKADYSTDEPMVAMTLHSLNTSGASLLADRTREEFNIVEMIPSKIGATIGANIGPGAAGVALSPSLAYLQG
jgi:fatty acid-binding protein DegV